MIKKVKRGLILLLASITMLNPIYTFAAENGNAGKDDSIVKLTTDTVASTDSKIHSKVKKALENEEYVEVLVQLNEKVDTAKAAKDAADNLSKNATDYNKKVAGRSAIVEKLKATAENSQKRILDYLAKEKDKGNVVEYQSYYIVNGIYVKANKNVIEQLSKHSEVKMIHYNEKVTVKWPEVTSTNIIPSENIEWGVQRVGAPDVWNNLQIDGTGVVVGLIDTGIDYLHPALMTKWRGYNPANPSQPNTTFNWFDPVDKSPLPQDILSIPHGSHVMGTILGGDASGQNAIGVAPGAKFIVAKGFSAMGGYNDDLIACGEWMLAPKDLGGVPHPEMAPDVINNSWGGASGIIDDFFRDVVIAWRNAGIVPVFAAGNDGPGETTVSCPGAYPEVFTVGAIDSNNTIADFSSRGPGMYDVNKQKPDVCAPGVNIRSSIPDQEGNHIYEGGWNGTSMATPHVTGVVTLMLSANSALTPDKIEEILKATAVRMTDLDFPESPNYAYGYGLVNAFDAVATVASGIGTITGKVAYEAQDTEIAAITHTPYPYVFTNEDTPIYAHVRDNVYPKTVELWVTTATGDLKIDMTKLDKAVTESEYKAVIPAQYVKDPSLKYQIKAYDYGGNLSQTIIYQVPTKFGIVPGQYETNFSSYPVGWKMNGNWQWGDATVGLKSPYGTNVLATNLDDEYTGDSNYVVNDLLVSAPIDLRNVSNASIVFDHWYSFGQDEYDASDFGRIQVSTDGKNWNVIRGFTDKCEKWVTNEADLTPYVGQKVYFGFLLTGNSMTKSLGWHIGKVKLTTSSQIAGTNVEKQTNLLKMESNTLLTEPTIPVDATVTVVETGRTLRTNPYDGTFTMKLMPTPEGKTHTLRVEAYGYKSMDKPFAIKGDQQLVMDYSLVPKGKGNITGTVINQVTGVPVAGAKIKVALDANVPAVIADANGKFAINNVYEGDYTLYTNIQGYTPIETKVTVTPNGTATCNINIKPFVTASSSEIAYEDGNCDTSHTFFSPNYGWAVKMTPNGYGLVKGIKGYTVDNHEWPGGSDFRVAIIDSRADGKPGETILMTDAITFTVGNWTYVDLSKYNFCTDRDFYAVMIQTNPKEYEAGIGIDVHNPQGRSYGYYQDGTLAPYKSLDEQDGNLMIRAEVDYNSSATVSIAPAISSPLNGATVKGTAAINATVNANVAIEKVEFYIDGTLVGTDTASPYTMDWDTTKVANGNHNLQVKAYDAAGNSGASAVTTVTVDNTIPDTTAPTCNITSPVNGSAVQGTTTISASAGDNVGVTKVEFYIDDSLKGTDFSSPHNYNWDTATSPIGVHIIQVKAYDAAGNVGTSTLITVNINPNIVPTLVSDTTDNTVGKSVDITFIEDAAWRAAITDILVDGTSISGKYTVNPGKITIDSSVLTVEKAYTIVVKANRYYDAAVTQQMVKPIILNPPTLKPNTKNNVVGRAITITFTDNILWRAAITDILVDGVSINGKYTVSGGKIVINSGVFATAKTYNITVKANGYLDATVNQVIRR